MVFHVHNRTVVPANSQWLWQDAQDMFKLNTDQIQHEGGGGHEVLELAEEPLVIDSDQEKGS